jgi:hypothetical protein
MTRRIRIRTHLHHFSGNIPMTRKLITVALTPAMAAPAAWAATPINQTRRSSSAATSRSTT